MKRTKASSAAAPLTGPRYPRNVHGQWVPRNPPSGPPRMGPDEITRLARDIVTNIVYLPDGPEAVHCSFSMVFAFADLSNEYISNVGLVVEEYAKATRMANNGYPMFTSCRLIHKGDVAALTDEITRLERALGPVENGVPNA